MADGQRCIARCGAARTVQGTQADSVANSLLSSYHDVLELASLLATVASYNLAQSPARSSQDLSQHRFERRSLFS